MKKCIASPLTDDEHRYIEELMAALGGRRCFRVKQCYRNAQRLIIHDDKKRLRYWEGLYSDGVPHAWVTINGKVVDVTQDAVNRKLKTLHETGDEYFGVVIDRRTVLRHALRTNEYAPVLSTIR
jgi:hypothetical protein